MKITDPSNNVLTITGLKLEFRDVNTKFFEANVKRLFNEAILDEYKQTVFNEKVFSFNNNDFYINSKLSEKKK